jgi:hypothetical protein
MHLIIHDFTHTSLDIYIRFRQDTRRQLHSKSKSIQQSILNQLSLILFGGAFEIGPDIVAVAARESPIETK